MFDSNQIIVCIYIYKTNDTYKNVIIKNKHTFVKYFSSFLPFVSIYIDAKFLHQSMHLHFRLFLLHLLFHHQAIEIVNEYLCMSNEVYKTKFRNNF